MTDNLTVFIVDDDPSVRDALGLLLGVHDYRLAVFADADRDFWMTAQEALEYGMVDEILTKKSK